MSVDDASKDLIFEKQILESNKLGNALLSGLIAEGVTGNKRNISITSSLKSLHEAAVTLKNEVNNIKAFKIGSCSDILEKENSDIESQAVLTEKLLNNIEIILKNHIKCNDPNVISEEEIQKLKSHMHILEAVQEELKKLPSSKENLQSHLKIVEGIKTSLRQITNNVHSSQKKLDDILNNEVVQQLSDEIYFSM